MTWRLLCCKPIMTLRRDQGPYKTPETSVSCTSCAGLTAPRPIRNSYVPQSCRKAAGIDPTRPHRACQDRRAPALALARTVSLAHMQPDSSDHMVAPRGNHNTSFAPSADILWPGPCSALTTCSACTALALNSLITHLDGRTQKADPPAPHAQHYTGTTIALIARRLDALVRARRVMALPFDHTSLRRIIDELRALSVPGNPHRRWVMRSTVACAEEGQRVNGLHSAAVQSALVGLHRRSRTAWRRPRGPTSSSTSFCWALQVKACSS